MTKKKAKLKIIELKRAIRLVLNTEGFNEEEKKLAKNAYLNLNTLRNSLHRYLLSKKS